MEYQNTRHERDDKSIQSSIELTQDASYSPGAAYSNSPAYSAPTRSRKRNSLHRAHPKPIQTSTGSMLITIPQGMLPSAPTSPPTPAPSPTPTSRVPDWSTAAEHEDASVRDVRALFCEMNDPEKLRLLAELLNMCNSQQLAFVHEFVSPRLKKDPFTSLPNELCLRILTFIDDPTTLARSSQVSRRWRELVSDDMAWKSLCEKHAYRRLSDEPTVTVPLIPVSHNHRHTLPCSQTPSSVNRNSSYYESAIPPFLNSVSDRRTQSLDRVGHAKCLKRRQQALSYRNHFKQRYMVETAWRSGGKFESRQITPDQGVVTSLHLTDKYIIVALDNAKIHVFDTSGQHQNTLQGHIMGVWAMVPWEDVLVSGGCDRDVRVWNMATGQSVHTLRGHTSTVRCLKMSDSTTAISGSRDTTLRVWDITKGICKHVLVGHQASVRCLEIHGDKVVSGSYDTTVRVWKISEGRCLRTLSGHFSQIYAIAFDGTRLATGSLDTSVRIWDPSDGRCLAVLQGHTSLVGQLQMRGDILVTGGSDGSVRVWSLTAYQPIHRLAAHDNSVTSLQFDDSRIISGGSDGRVKVWDLKRGNLVRELSQPADAVWRVVFEEEKAVIMANRSGKTVMEVWNFSPPEEEVLEDSRSESSLSMPDQIMTEFQSTPSSLRSANTSDVLDRGDTNMADTSPLPS